jgi:hypothetical protein
MTHDIASTSDGLVLLWDVTSGREIARFANHTKPAYSVAWNRLNDTLLASVGGDNFLLVLEVDLPTLMDPANYQPVTGVVTPAKAPSRRSSLSGLFMSPGAQVPLHAFAPIYTPSCSPYLIPIFMSPGAHLMCALPSSDTCPSDTCLVIVQVTAAQMQSQKQQEGRLTESNVTLRFNHPAPVFGP